MKPNSSFYNLTPDLILDSIELALDSKTTGVRATGRSIALNSLENRVYEIDLDDNSSVVAKFYRPGRWTKECILEEHEFVCELAEAEIPAVVPKKLSNGSTLMTTKIEDTDIYFALFEKTRGRIEHELNDEQLEQTGRLLARLHLVGEKKTFKHRIGITPQTFGYASSEFLKNGHFVEPQIETAYFTVLDRVLKKIDSILSAPVKNLRIHGDCHLGNVLWSGTQAFFIDFDDTVTGPAVQDLWLTVRGRDEFAVGQRNQILDSYTTMREFDFSELKRIEALRTLRMIHYSAWIAKRFDDPAFKNYFADFGSYKYWQGQVQDLEEQERYLG